MLRNCALVASGNVIGCLLVSGLLAKVGGLFEAGSPPQAALLIAVAEKLSRPWGTNVMRGVGCNILVSLAVYVSSAGTSVGDKAAAIWPPITAMVFIGFEHIVVDFAAAPLAVFCGADLSFWDVLISLWLPVALGNLGGALCIAIVYDCAFRPTIYSSLPRGDETGALQPGLSLVRGTRARSRELVDYTLGEAASLTPASPLDGDAVKNPVFAPPRSLNEAASINVSHSKTLADQA